MASDSRPTEGGDECIREKLDTRQDHELAVEVFDDAFIGSLGLRKAELGGPKERLSNWDEHTSHLDGNSPGASRMRQEQGANWESWELTSIHPHSKQDSRISVIGCRTLVLESNSDRCVVPLNARGRWRGSARGPCRVRCRAAARSLTSCSLVAHLSFNPAGIRSATARERGEPPRPRTSSGRLGRWTLFCASGITGSWNSLWCLLLTLAGSTPLRKQGLPQGCPANRNERRLQCLSYATIPGTLPSR